MLRFASVLSLEHKCNDVPAGRSSDRLGDLRLYLPPLECSDGLRDAVNHRGHLTGPLWNRRSVSFSPGVRKISGP